MAAEDYFDPYGQPEDEEYCPPTPECPYCGADSYLVDGLYIYPHRPDLKDKMFYICPPCDAYVGCHPGTTNPLGRLANADLRKAKMAAHRSFDVRWKLGGMSRKEAYKWLAAATGIKNEECHIGMMDEKQCARVVIACALREK